MRRLHLLVTGVAAFSAGCEEPVDTQDTDRAFLASAGLCAIRGDVSYQNAIADIAAVRCGACHSAEGAQRQEPLFVDEWRFYPWWITTGEVSPEWFAQVVAAGTMPISQAGQLTDVEKSTVASWVEGHVGDTAALATIPTTMAPPDYTATYATALDTVYRNHCYFCHSNPNEINGAPYFSGITPTTLEYPTWEPRHAQVVSHTQRGQMPSNTTLTDEEKQLFTDYDTTRSDADWAALQPLLDSNCLQCHGVVGAAAPDWTRGTGTAVDRATYDVRSASAVSRVQAGTMPKQIPLVTDADDLSMLLAWRAQVGMSMRYDELFGTDIGFAAVTAVTPQDLADPTRPVQITYTGTDADSAYATVSLYWSTTNEEVDGELIDDCLPSGTDRPYTWATAGVAASPAEGYYVWACVHDDDNVVCDFGPTRVVIAP